VEKLGRGWTKSEGAEAPPRHRAYIGRLLETLYALEALFATMRYINLHLHLQFTFTIVKKTDMEATVAKAKAKHLDFGFKGLTPLPSQ